MSPVPFDLKEELLRNDFRVSIFGSARIKEGDPMYQETHDLAYALAEMGVDLVTGGGPGLMEAASVGHRAGDKESKVDSIGLNIRLPFEQKPNDSLDVVENHDRFSTRLDEFMLLSNVVVVMPGGIGTCLELFYTWQLLQVNHIKNIPVIVVGDMWEQLLNWVKNYPLQAGFMNPEDMDFVVSVEKGSEALEIIKGLKAQFEAGGPDAALNWTTYGKRF